MIEKAMKECHIALKPNRNAKQQVGKAIIDTYVLIVLM